MTPGRWQQIREVLAKALELAPDERHAFLNRACSSDRSLRQEVETLLASSDDVRSSFLRSSTLRVTLTAGTKLGEYEVKSLVGAGGMGEMYRARDSRLGRDVAIKVLPSSCGHFAILSDMTGVEPYLCDGRTTWGNSFLFKMSAESPQPQKDSNKKKSANTNIFQLLFMSDRPPRYAAPNLTDTSFDTPGSCMVTP
jgi:hypothetical protein